MVILFATKKNNCFEAKLLQNQNELLSLFILCKFVEPRCHSMNSVRAFEFMNCQFWSEKVWCNFLKSAEKQHFFFAVSSRPVAVQCSGDPAQTGLALPSWKRCRWLGYPFLVIQTYQNHGWKLRFQCGPLKQQASSSFPRHVDPSAWYQWPASDSQDPNKGQPTNRATNQRQICLAHAQSISATLPHQIHAGKAATIEPVSVGRHQTIRPIDWLRTGFKTGCRTLPSIPILRCNYFFSVYVCVCVCNHQTGHSIKKKS